jgi:hypothetical protein
MPNPTHESSIARAQSATIHRECSHAAAIVANTDYDTCRFAASLKRMMGFEPTTFCMANARDVRTRSRAFAQSVVFAGSSSK